MADVGSVRRPPSEKLSGVTFTIPMTSGRRPNSIAESRNCQRSGAIPSRYTKAESPPTAVGGLSRGTVLESLLRGGLVQFRLDRLEDVRVIRRGAGLEPADDLAVTADQELLEVPADLGDLALL